MDNLVTSVVSLFEVATGEETNIQDIWRIKYRKFGFTKYPGKITNGFELSFAYHGLEVRMSLVY